MNKKTIEKNIDGTDFTLTVCRGSNVFHTWADLKVNGESKVWIDADHNGIIARHTDEGLFETMLEWA